MDQQESLVVGVFAQEPEARQFLDSLRNAGFERDDLGLALREGGAPTTNLVEDFVQLGLNKAEAEFYYQEVLAGKAVASIRTAERTREIRDLLLRFGAYDYSSRSTNPAQHPNDSIPSLEDPLPADISEGDEQSSDPLLRARHDLEQDN